MNGRARVHPSTEQLRRFVAASLNTGESAAISAHLDMCTSCSETARILEAETARTWFAGEPEQLPREFDDILDGILSTPAEPVAQHTRTYTGMIHLDECSVVLPRALARAASEGLFWKKLPGGINQARLALDNETQCDLLYMKPGGRIPLHKHQGSEITLVLEGSFSDENGHYTAGDFVQRHGEETHSPVTREGCLCFTVLDSPLTFTKGLARLLNPINRYLFNRA